MAETNPQATPSPRRSNHIGTLAENSLHAALKTWYARPSDQLEASVDGYVIDILRGEQLIEIQTRHFSALKIKLARLLENHTVHLVYPIAQEKWIVRLAGDGTTPLGRRKSPRRGRLEDLFSELVRIPALIAHPNFSLEVLLIQEEELWQNDGRGSWRRRGWSIRDRRLLGVSASLLLSTPEDFRPFLPEGLPQVFTTRDLARAARQQAYLARRMVYCLRAMGVIEQQGKRGKAFLYTIVD